jgi:phage gp29-like protein
MAEKKTGKSGELGVPGLQQWGGRVQEQWIPALRNSEKRIKVYDEMARMSPTGSAMIQTTTMFMKSVTPQVIPSGDSDAEKEMAEHIERNLNTMSRSWEEVMGDIVWYIVYGFFDEEIVYEKREDGKIYWRKWAPRHPITLDRWEFDSSGGLQGMHQQWDSASVYIPIEKLLHFSTTGAGKGNPEGNSVLEGAYQPWFFIKNLSILQAIICERMSGTPVINMPSGASLDDTDPNSDLSRAKRIVRNIKTGDEMGLTLPYEWEFEYKMPHSGPAIDIGDVIQSHKKDFAETLMMGFIVMGSIGEAGSWAMIKDKTAMYISALNTFLRQIASVINRHGIPRLMKLNAYPKVDEYPKLKFPKITKIDLGDYAEIISVLLNAGALTYDLETEKSIRETIGLPKIDKPGLLLKPNLPAEQAPGEPPEGKDVGGADMPKEQAVKNSFSDKSMAMEASNIVDEIALRLISVYDKILKNLPKDLEATDEDDWADLVDWYTDEVYEALKDKLSDEMVAAWMKFVKDKPKPEEYRVIIDELFVQSDYLKNSLMPAFTALVLNTARLADPKVFRMAIAGAIASFRYRVGTYANSVFKVYGNHANAAFSKKRMNDVFPNNDIEMDWDRGILVGDDLLGRYVGADDERTCFGCDRELDKGWTNTNLLTPIGSNECGNNCRHVIQYKYHGRVF